MALFDQSEASGAEVDASTPLNGSVGDRTSSAATLADAVDGDAAPAGRGERLLPRRGPGRALLKRIYYSWGLRTLAGWPLDLLDRVRGHNDPLLPPRRLRYVGRGDFETVGIQWRKHLVARQALTPATDFLDIGCGVGRVAVALAPVLEQGSYEGFDIVAPAIRWCQREITPRHPSFTFTLADVRNDQYNPRGGVAASEFTFPYPDETFDVALAASVFTHMRPAGISRYLAEPSGSCGPAGVCSVSCSSLTPSQRRCWPGSGPASRLTTSSVTSPRPVPWQRSAPARAQRRDPRGRPAQPRSRGGARPRADRGGPLVRPLEPSLQRPGHPGQASHPAQDEPMRAPAREARMTPAQS